MLFWCDSIACCCVTIADLPFVGHSDALDQPGYGHPCVVGPGDGATHEKSPVEEAIWSWAVHHLLFNGSQYPLPFLLPTDRTLRSPIRWWAIIEGVGGQVLSLRWCKSFNFSTILMQGRDHWPMFPVIFKSLCAHKISFGQHFTRTHLYLERRVWNLCKNMFGRNIYVRSKFSCVRSSHGLCARAQLRVNIGRDHTECTM